MMVLCDRWGRVYDVWISFGRVHEVRAFWERKRRSLWFRKLVESCVVFGYRGCEGVIVCGSRESHGLVKVIKDLDRDIECLKVLLVDDILDTGYIYFPNRCKLRRCPYYKPFLISWWP